jgi:hypothetical protein
MNNQCSKCGRLKVEVVCKRVRKRGGGFIYPTPPRKCLRFQICPHCKGGGARMDAA